MPDSQIKTSTHPVNRPLRMGARKNKLDRLSLFVSDYAEAVRFYTDFLWKNGCTWTTKAGTVNTFSIKDDLLNCPSFISTTDIPFASDLSARALKCASTQACGIVRAAVDKRKRLLYAREQLFAKGERTRNITTAIRKTPCLKPNLANVYPELNSVCANFAFSENCASVDGFLTLSSLGKKYGKLVLPINMNRHSEKLYRGKNASLMPSFSVSPNNVYLRWEIPLPPLKSDGIVVGGDTGINSVLTLSDKQQTVPNAHGTTLNSILKKVASKKKGSKAFHRALDERDNFLNWSIGQIDFSNIKELRLEKISNFRHGKNVGKFLNHFGEPVIRGKLMDVARQAGVLVIEQSSFYRSQRCHGCGFVCRKNRSGKHFGCKHCFLQADADYNASCNHEVKLPDIVPFLQLYGKTKKSKRTLPSEGFFWKENGFFAIDGSELTVPNKPRK